MKNACKTIPLKIYNSIFAFPFEVKLGHAHMEALTAGTGRLFPRFIDFAFHTDEQLCALK